MKKIQGIIRKDFEKSSDIIINRNGIFWILCILSLLVMIFFIKDVQATILLSDNATVNDSNSSSTQNTIALYLPNSYYSVNDVINISIMNRDLLDPNASLSLEISLDEDPAYSFKYLGLVEDNVLFVPKKVGNYRINLYETKSDSINLISTKTFLVYDPLSSKCRSYLPGDNIVINFSSYPQYDNTTSNTLPLSVVLIFNDLVSGDSEKFVYTQEIKQTIIYQSYKIGKYSLFADDVNIDCFVISSIQNDTQNNFTNISINNSINNAINNSNILDNLTVQSLIESFLNTNTTTNIQNNSVQIMNSQVITPIAYDISSPLDFSKDKIEYMKGLQSGYVAATIIRGGISGLDELWIFSSDGKMRKLVGYNDSAPAEDFDLGIKDDNIFWISKDRSKVYLYNVFSGKTLSRVLSPYDLSNGELGKVDFSNNGFAVNDSVCSGDACSNDYIALNWQVELDNSQFYFYNKDSGQVFSDDSLDIKETFRKSISLDNLVAPEAIASLDLEIDRNFVTQEAK